MHALSVAILALDWCTTHCTMGCNTSVQRHETKTKTTSVQRESADWLGIGVMADNATNVELGASENEWPIRRMESVFNFKGEVYRRDMEVDQISETSHGEDSTKDNFIIRLAAGASLKDALQWQNLCVKLEQGGGTIKYKVSTFVTAYQVSLGTQDGVPVSEFTKRFVRDTAKTLDPQEDRFKTLFGDAFVETVELGGVLEFNISKTKGTQELNVAAREGFSLKKEGTSFEMKFWHRGGSGTHLPNGTTKSGSLPELEKAMTKWRTSVPENPKVIRVRLGSYAPVLDI